MWGGCSVLKIWNKIWKYFMEREIGIKSPFPRCSLHLSTRQIWRLCNTERNCQQDVKPCNRVYVPFSKHLVISQKSCVCTEHTFQNFYSNMVYTSLEWILTHSQIIPLISFMCIIIFQISTFSGTSKFESPTHTNTLF